MSCHSVGLNGAGCSNRRAGTAAAMIDPVSTTATDRRREPDLFDVVDHRQRSRANLFAQVGIEDAAADDLVELLGILPTPRQVRLHHDVEHEVHRFEPDRVPTHRLLQVDVPTEVTAVGTPRHQDRVPVIRSHDPQTRHIPDVLPE